MHQAGGAVVLSATLAGSKSDGPTAGRELTLNIAAKELLPIVIGTGIWGSAWHGKCIKIRSDNQAVVQVLSSRSAKDPHLSHLLRSLFFFQAHFGFEISASHIAGKDNRAADALSRNELSNFFSIFPQANPHPTAIPDQLLVLLLDQRLLWTSPRWRELFNSCLLKVSPHPPGQLTHLVNPGISNSVSDLALHPSP
jgi:hypothetical protein